MRAHYLEIYEENIFSISGYGQIVYFNKNNLLSDSLKFKVLSNSNAGILTGASDCTSCSLLKIRNDTFCLINYSE